MADYNKHFHIFVWITKEGIKLARHRSCLGPSLLTLNSLISKTKYACEHIHIISILTLCHRHIQQSTQILLTLIPSEHGFPLQSSAAIPTQTYNPLVLQPPRYTSSLVHTNLIHIQATSPKSEPSTLRVAETCLIPELYTYNIHCHASDCRLSS